jgi:hypothetical protein
MKPAEAKLGDLDAAGAEADATVHAVDADKLASHAARGAWLLRGGGGLTLAAGLAVVAGGGLAGWALAMLGATLATTGLAYRAWLRALGSPGATGVELRANGLLLRVAGTEHEVTWDRLHGGLALDGAGPLAGTRVLLLDGPGPFVPDVLDVPPQALAELLDALRWLVGPGSEGRQAVLPGVEHAEPLAERYLHPEDRAALEGLTSTTRLDVEGYHPPWVHLRHGERRLRVLPAWPTPIVVVDGQVRAGLEPPEG